MMHSILIGALLGVIIAVLTYEPPAARSPAPAPPLFKGYILPSQSIKKIGDMVPGDCGWTVPWALRRAGANGFLLRGSFDISTKDPDSKYSTTTVYVMRTDSEFVVDISACAKDERFDANDATIAARDMQWPIQVPTLSRPSLSMRFRAAWQSRWATV